MKAALTCIALLAASPAAAFDTMTLDLCQQSFRAGADMIPEAEPDASQVEAALSTTPDGWCRIAASDHDWADVAFETLDWRTDGTASWIDEGIPPLGLEVRMLGLDPDKMENGAAATDRPLLSLHATLRQESAAGQVILERAVLENEAGDVLAVSGVIDRIYLSSKSMMQVSVGSAAVRAALLTVTRQSEYSNPFGFNLDAEWRGDPQARRQGMFDQLSLLPDGVIDDASRAELMAYVGDLPAPLGTLDVSFASARGMGLLQMGASAAMAFVDVMDGDDEAERQQLEILLDGITVTADWSPAAQVAD